MKENIDNKWLTTQGLLVATPTPAFLDNNGRKPKAQIPLSCSGRKWPGGGRPEAGIPKHDEELLPPARPSPGRERIKVCLVTSDLGEY